MREREGGGGERETGRVEWLAHFIGESVTLFPLILNETDLSKDQ